MSEYGCFEIEKIQIPTSMEPISPFWAPSKSGKFTTKAAFHAIQLCSGPADQEGEILGKRIWSLDIHNRLKVVIWRTLFDTLPTRGKISQFFQIPVTECPFCDSQVETAQHLFMCCPFAEQVWFLSKWQVRLNPLNHLSIREWFLQISDPKTNFFPETSIQREFTITWAITLEAVWRARNDRVHGNRIQQPKEIAGIIAKLTIEHLTARNKRGLKPQTNCEWMPPPPKWIKVNVDAAFKEEKGTAAFVVREHSCHLIHAAAAQISVYDSNLAELRALRIATEKMHAIQAKKVIFESDSSVAIKWISSKADEVDRVAKNDVQAIQTLRDMWPNWSFRKIPRTCNEFAHGVAKWAHGANWNGPIPPPIFPRNVFCDKGPSSLEFYNF